MYPPQGVLQISSDGGDWIRTKIKTWTKYKPPKNPILNSKQPQEKFGCTLFAELRGQDSWAVCSDCFEYPKNPYLRTFASLKLWVTHVKKCKKIGGSKNSFRRYDVQKITQNLRNRASLLHTDKVPVCAKSLQINPWIEILSANYCSCGSINKIRWTKKLPQSWFYHLADTFLLS